MWKQWTAFQNYIVIKSVEVIIMQCNEHQEEKKRIEHNLILNYISAQPMKVMSFRHVY